MRTRRGAFWTVLATCWIGAVMAGLASLMSYDNRSGPAAHAPETWPAASHLPRDSARPTLVMLAHPRCDCTRASVGELAELMARVRQRPQVFVVFIKPGRVEADWEKTALWQEAARIPGVTVVRDDRGDEASRFGTETSGETLLYDRAGHLVFSGGMTGARGKSGDNAGRATLIEWLDGAAPAQATSPVFGCSLFGPADEPARPEGHHHDS